MITNRFNNRVRAAKIHPDLARYCLNHDDLNFLDRVFAGSAPAEVTRDFGATLFRWVAFFSGGNGQGDYCLKQYLLFVFEDASLQWFVTNEVWLVETDLRDKALNIRLGALLGMGTDEGVRIGRSEFLRELRKADILVEYIKDQPMASVPARSGGVVKALLHRGPTPPPKIEGLPESFWEF